VDFQYLMITDEDVEVTNITDFLHSAFAKAHPVRSVQIMELAPGHALIPFSDLHDKMHARGANLTLDATTPPEWLADGTAPHRVSFRDSFPLEAQATAARVLSSLGIGNP
jgi:3-polyprenyl-4-hydroxybenzoate decarboxylase